jgi:hypothetical protein
MRVITSTINALASLIAIAVVGHGPLYACSLAEDCGDKWVALQEVGEDTSLFNRDSKPVLASDVKVGDILTAKGEIHVRTSPANWAHSSFSLRKSERVLVAALQSLPAKHGRRQLWVRIRSPDQSPASPDQSADKSPPAGVDQHYVVCTQDMGSICPNGDALFGGRSQEMGENICAIYTSRGRQIFPSEVRSRGDGHYDLICHNMPQDSVIEWHPYNCMTDDQRNCSPRDHFFECGDYVSAARQVCTQNGVVKPYQYFKTSDVNAGQCGIIHLTVGCYVPAQ